MRLIPHNENSQKGFTLIELLVSMGLFIIIMVIASEAFNKIIVQSSKYAKIEESNIEGIIGLEVMRHDLEQMGFGLPWSWSARNPTNTGPLENCGLKYSEATNAKGAVLNDSPNGIPRAFVAQAGLGNFSSAHIAIKGTNLGRSKASQRWTYIPFLNFSAATRESRPVSFSSNNLAPNNMVLMVNSNSNSELLDHTLIVEPGSSNTSTNDSVFSAAFKNDGTIAANYLPTDQNQTYLLYGLLDSNTPAPRMPFNRSDFFIGQNLGGNVVPPSCAPRTGVLYKATINHGVTADVPPGGEYNYIPLLDCVADMQVVLGWDAVARSSSKPIDTNVNAYSSLSAVSGGAVTTVPAAAAGDIQNWLISPKGVREQLKMVKVYLLVQEGKRDISYTAPATMDVGDLTIDGFRKVYAFTDEQRKYRWKLYRIVVRPKNLISNSF